jgi:hypothetical protein
MHEGIKPGASLRHDMAAETGKIIGAGVARRHAGRGALVRDQFVGRNANSGAVGIDVAMQVDQARRHQLSGSIEHAQRARLGDVGFHGFNQPEADTDVALGAQRLAGVEYIAALDQQVEFVIRPHGSTGATA